MAKCNPRIRSLGSIGGIKIWEVNGPLVRKNIDAEFTDAGQHFKFKFIPKDELWIDKENDPGETDFFIMHLLVERKAMELGISYKKALKLADRAEAAERFKSEKFNLAKKLDGKKNLTPYLHELMSLGNINVWLVDGEIVRDLLFIDFTEGGHGYIYDFIPKDEIWIDNDVIPTERLYIIAHEFLERRLMMKGKKYQPAHKAALKIEWMMRNSL